MSLRKRKSEGARKSFFFKGVGNKHLCHWHISLLIEKKSTEYTFFVFIVFVEHFSSAEEWLDEHWNHIHFYQICSIDLEEKHWTFDDVVPTIVALCDVALVQVFYSFPPRNYVDWLLIFCLVCSRIFDNRVHEFVCKILPKVFLLHRINPTKHSHARNVFTIYLTCIDATR